MPVYASERDRGWTNRLRLGTRIVSPSDGTFCVGDTAAMLCHVVCPRRMMPVREVTISYFWFFERCIDVPNAARLGLSMCYASCIKGITDSGQLTAGA